MTSYDKVLAARDINRPTAKMYIDKIIEDFNELHGDRNCGDDAAIITGIGKLNSITVTVVGIEKGVDTKDKIKHNFSPKINNQYIITYKKHFVSIFIITYHVYVIWDTAQSFSRF